jgi:hypothetical protein
MGHSFNFFYDFEISPEAKPRLIGTLVWLARLVQAAALNLDFVTLGPGSGGTCP